MSNISIFWLEQELSGLVSERIMTPAFVLFGVALLVLERETIRSSDN